MMLLLLLLLPCSTATLAVMGLEVGYVKVNVALKAQNADSLTRGLGVRVATESSLCSEHTVEFGTYPEPFSAWAWIVCQQTPLNRRKP